LIKLKKKIFNQYIKLIVIFFKDTIEKKLCVPKRKSLCIVINKNGEKLADKRVVTNPISMFIRIK